MTKTHPESPEPTKGLAPATGPATGQPDIHGWRTIESAPEGQNILAAKGNVVTVTNYCCELDGQKWWNFFGGQRWQPTHWQLLPAPPESEQ